MFRWIVLGIAAAFRPRAQLIAENLCLRQQLVVLQRKQMRPSLRDRDRRSGFSQAAALLAGERHCSSRSPIRYCAGIERAGALPGAGSRVYASEEGDGISRGGSES